MTAFLPTTLLRNLIYMSLVLLAFFTIAFPTPIRADEAKDDALHQQCFYGPDKDVANALILLPNFQDPKCQSFDVVQLLLKDIASQLIRFVLAIAFIFLVITGYQFVTSMGNKTGMEDAKRSLLFITIGILVVLSAYMVVTFISNRFLNPKAGETTTQPPQPNPTNAKAPVPAPTKSPTIPPIPNPTN